LRVTLVEYEVKEPEAAVEAVCSQVSGWLRTLADDWYGSTTSVDPMRQSAATVVLGLADGIDNGAPGFGTQNPGVE
jgi:hypothetical protein